MHKEFTNNHIIIEYSDQLPFNIPKTIAQNIEESRYKIGTVKRQSHVYAGLEWVIPTAIAIYLTRPFFDEFFRLSAKSAFNYLHDKMSVRKEEEAIIEWLKEEITKAKSIRFEIISSSPEKVNKSDTQSKSISVLIPLRNGNRVKLLFDEAQNEETWRKAIDKLFLVLKEHYKNFPNDSLNEKITQLRDKRQFLYSTYNEKNNDWDLYDLNKIALKSRFDKIQSVTNNSRNLIRKNNLKSALSLLLKTTELGDFRDRIINLESRLNQLAEDENMGILTHEEKTITKNKVLKSFTDLLTKIDHEFDYK